MKPFVTLSLLSMTLFTSCSVLERLSNPGEYTPIYLEEPSPLDPPGMDAIRAEARAKYVKEGLYKDGETLEVQQGKAFLFNRNPDYYEGAKGRMIQSANARIISCEGLYYFVELDNGSKGFLRETDFVNPVKLVSNSLENLLPEESWDTPGSMDGEQQVMTNTSGRAVLVVKKTSKKTDEFNARRRELLNKQATAPADDTALPTPTEELPEPAGCAGE
jgi:hypothetical protein